MINQINDIEKKWDTVLASGDSRVIAPARRSSTNSLWQIAAYLAQRDPALADHARRIAHKIETQYTDYCAPHMSEDLR